MIASVSMTVLLKILKLKKALRFRQVGIFTLLFAVLLLPMLHRHPEIDHAHGATEGHQHQAALHADFFPDATHGHQHSDDQAQHESDFDVSIHPSQHTFSQIDFHSLHIGQSFQFSSFFKKQALSLDQALLELFVFRGFGRGIPKHQHAPPLQVLQFSPPSLRAPPYFA